MKSWLDWGLWGSSLSATLLVAGKLVRVWDMSWWWALSPVLAFWGVMWIWMVIFAVHCLFPSKGEREYRARRDRRAGVVIGGKVSGVDVSMLPEYQMRGAQVMGILNGTLARCEERIKFAEANPNNCRSCGKPMPIGNDTCSDCYGEPWKRTQDKQRGSK